MLRRAGQSKSQTPSTIGGGGSNHSSGGFANRFSRRSNNNNKQSGRKWQHPIVLLCIAIALACYVSWSFFPTQVVEMEHEAEIVGHRLAQEAIDVEHQVQDWLNYGTGTGDGANNAANNNNMNNIPVSRRTSESATARMLAQSSKWVDGEKALKRKLAVLEEEQRQNKNLGVPVLTRYLGEDFPAYVTPDMDEAEWRQQVKIKYEEMRKEEEEWIKQMQKIIDQRERDIGITTAR